FVAVVDEGRWLGTEPPLDRDAQRERFSQPLEQPESAASLVAVAGDRGGGRIVGHVLVHLERYGVAGLGMMVDDGWRGRGVGRALVDAAVQAEIGRASGRERGRFEVERVEMAIER